MSLLQCMCRIPGPNVSFGAATNDPQAEAGVVVGQIQANHVKFHAVPAHQEELKRVLKTYINEGKPVPAESDGEGTRRVDLGRDS